MCVFGGFCHRFFLPKFSLNIRTCHVYRSAFKGGTRCDQCDRYDRWLGRPGPGWRTASPGSSPPPTLRWRPSSVPGAAPGRGGPPLTNDDIVLSWVVVCPGLWFAFCRLQCRDVVLCIFFKHMVLSDVFFHRSPPPPPQPPPSPASPGAESEDEDDLAAPNAPSGCRLARRSPVPGVGVIHQGCI